MYFIFESFWGASNGLFYIPIPKENGNSGVIPVEPGISSCPPGSYILLSSPNKTKKTASYEAIFYGDPERTRTVDLQRDRLAC